MAVELLRHSHDHRIGKVGDAASSASVFLFEDAVPIDGFAESFFLDEIVALAKDAFGTARCFKVLDRDDI